MPAIGDKVPVEFVKNHTPASDKELLRLARKFPTKTQRKGR